MCGSKTSYKPIIVHSHFLLSTCQILHNQPARNSTDMMRVIVDFTNLKGTLRFIGRQRDGNGKKTLYDMCL